MTEKPNETVVSIERAREQLDRAQDVEPETNGDDDEKRRRRSKGDWPEDSPVTPLGKDKGQYHFLDSTNQHRVVPGGKLAKLEMLSVHGGNLDYLKKHFPRYGGSKTEPVITTFEGERASAAFMQACSAMGIWDPTEKLCGLGSWRGKNGELIQHCGDKIGIFPADGGAERWLPPGLIDGRVFAAEPPGARPCGKTVVCLPSATEEVVEVLSSFIFRRPRVDSHLALGWIAIAIVGGAAPCRPIIWGTGPRGCGKTKLMEFFTVLLGGDAIVGTDVTGAGIWQTTKNSTRPVMIDEMEPEPTKKRTDAIVRLFRSSYSGGQIRRGGADHHASEFVARNSFGFFSILIPPLQPQDFSRTVVLNITAAPRHAKQLDLKESVWWPIGEKLRRRMVNGWPVFFEILEAYETALLEQGHDRRRADTLGVLLTGAHILRYDHGGDTDLFRETVDYWVKDLAPEVFEILDEEDTAESCLRHLLTTTVRTSPNNSQESVSTLVEHASALDLSGNVSNKDAGHQLVQYGLRVCEHENQRYLAIANSHAELGKLFERTPWSKDPGTSGG